MTRIQKAAKALITKHGGLRAAARATGMDAGYLSRIRNGKHPNPGPVVMQHLGIEKRVTYRCLP